MTDFTAFPKIPRLSRGCIITEKIDGTNASVFVPDNYPVEPLLFGSRTRWITPENDNHGFATWGNAHIAELASLGPGHHFGEWWGPGINRGYGGREKVFSLFNVNRWADDSVYAAERGPRPACCSVVPTLYTGPFDTHVIDVTLDLLDTHGSWASPGFMRPEGIVIWHVHSRTFFKKTIGDDGHKNE